MKKLLISILSILFCAGCYTTRTESHADYGRVEYKTLSPVTKVALTPVTVIGGVAAGAAGTVVFPIQLTSQLWSDKLYSGSRILEKRKE